MSILASSLALGAADYTGATTRCAGTPIPSCSSRSARPGTALTQIERAKQVCGECTVRVDCLDFALTTNQDSGVWGGLSEEERRVIRRQRAARAARDAG